jgi:ribosomal protein L11 methyltransferase
MSAEPISLPGSYFEVAIHSEESLNDELIGLMSQLGFEGFWEDKACLRCYMSNTRWKPAILTEVRKMVGLLFRPSETEFPQISVRTIEEENWNAAWERTVEPIHMTARIVVAPTWQQYTPEKGELLLRINPKMSFGTGYHESTRLAARLLEEHLKPEMRVLDIGTGTGILAIAAAKLGAGEAFGIDTDDWAYNNARENVELNGVQDRITIRRGSVTDLAGDSFDLILANIQRDVIERLLGKMIDRLRPSGLLIFSGLLADESRPVLDMLEASHLTVLRKIQEGDWIALAARRTRGPSGQINPAP